jgi:hypothetical protein
VALTWAIFYGKNMYQVIKWNKRLYVADENGERIYTPPDFLLPLRNRDGMKELAKTEMKIRDIMEFEEGLRK